MKYECVIVKCCMGLRLKPEISLILKGMNDLKRSLMAAFADVVAVPGGNVDNHVTLHYSLATEP